MEKEGTVQHSLEQSAKVSKVVFNAPPTFLTYGYVLLASAFFGLFLQPSPAGALAGFLLLGVPALIAGPLSAPVANALGGTLYYKRAAFLAAVSATIVGVVLVLAVPFRVWFDAPLAHVLLVGYMMATSTRHATLWATSDNRHLRSLPVSLLQALAAVPFIMGALPLLEGDHAFGGRELLIGAALAFIFLAPLVFFLRIFDTPMKKSFRVSASELFRYYLDHLTSGRMDGEAILSRFAEPVRAKFGVIGFKRRDGSMKAAMVVPALHPGPIGRLGGSDLPGKVAEAVPDCDLVMVPHGAATHDYNPVSTKDVERFGRAAADLLKTVAYKEGGSRAMTTGEDIRVTAQIFGDTALLSYTAWPLPIDDVEFAVGQAAELTARNSGVDRAFFVDCHNSLLPGAGQVWPNTPRGDAIIDASGVAARAAVATHVASLRVGVAKDDKSFTRAHGIGGQGVQVLVVETRLERADAPPDVQKFGYILWDGNNAVPEVTRAIGEQVKGLLDAFQVMTTDNHSVNAVAGSYGPVGHLVPPSDIAKVTRLAVEQALSDLEPVTSGGAAGVLEDFLVFGHQKTVQLTSSINTMSSIMLELLAATITIQWLGTALLFLLLR